jgi:HEAT repeat protein
MRNGAERVRERRKVDAKELRRRALSLCLILLVGMMSVGCGDGVSTGSLSDADRLLLSRLADADASVRSEAIHAIPPGTEISGEVYSAIVGRLRDDSVDVRVAAACALWRLNTRVDDRGLEGLGACLSHPSARVRSAALEAIGRVEGVPTGAAAHLKRLAGDPHPIVRAEVARAVQGDRLLWPEGCAIVQSLLEDQDRGVREAAARALGRALANSNAAVDPLASALEREDDARVALSQSEAIWRISGSVDELLRRALEGSMSADVGLRRISVLALREVTATCKALPHQRLKERLMALGDDADCQVRDDARVALLQLERLGDQ